MGLFGPFSCAFCGRTFYGLSWSIKGGKTVCGRCYNVLGKEMPYGKWHRMNISQIREHFDEKERLAEQADCSYCGKTFDSSDIYRFVLKDKTQICYSCGESMRIARPVFCTEELDTQREEFKFASDDPFSEMCIEDIKPAQEEAEKERARRAEKYGEHKAVFLVDDVVKSADEKDTHLIWGQMLLGRVDPNTIVNVKRRERPYYFVISSVRPLEYNKKATSLLEGHGGALVTKDDTDCIYPGDILTAD